MNLIHKTNSNYLKLQNYICIYLKKTVRIELKRKIKTTKKKNYMFSVNSSKSARKM